MGNNRAHSRHWTLKQTLRLQRDAQNDLEPQGARHLEALKLLVSRLNSWRSFVAVHDMDLVPLPVSYKRAPVCLCPTERVAQNSVLFPTRGLVSTEQADHYPSALDTASPLVQIRRLPAKTFHPSTTCPSHTCATGFRTYSG